MRMPTQIVLSRQNRRNKSADLVRIFFSTSVFLTFWWDISHSDTIHAQISSDFFFDELFRKNPVYPMKMFATKNGEIFRPIFVYVWIFVCFCHTELEFHSILVRQLRSNALFKNRWFWCWCRIHFAMTDDAFWLSFIHGFFFSFFKIK